jgi:hypothetical protein
MPIAEAAKIAQEAGLSGQYAKRKIHERIVDLQMLKTAI